MNFVDEASALIESVRSEFPDVVRLAQAVSLAVRVEPELLRSIRLALLPGVCADVEADLWFSALVQSENPLALVLLSEVEALLRQELSSNQELLNQVWEILQRVHKDTPPAIRLEEEVTWLALSNRGDAQRRIEELLLSVVAAMVKQNRRGLVRWAARALPRLPDRARKSRAAWLLAIGAGARLGGQQILKEEVPGDVVEEWLRWTLPKDLLRVPV